MAPERTIEPVSEDSLFIVFGAGGRVGQQLLPLLVNSGVAVLAVARENKPASHSLDVSWIQVDVADPSKGPTNLRALARLAGAHERTVLIDLLLKRTTVPAMRTSIAAATAYIVQLRDRLAAQGQRSSLTAGSTTAVLAPWAYQTPYGLAKRRQLQAYVAAGMNGTVLLLPSLTCDEGERARQPGFMWTYGGAAARIADAAHRMPTALTLAVPAIDPLCTRFPGGSTTEGMHSLRTLVPLHIDCWIRHRDSPQAHRDASHARLAVTPAWLRREVDHHALPPALLRRLNRSLGLPIRWVPAGQED